MEKQGILKDRAYVEIYIIFDGVIHLLKMPKKKTNLWLGESLIKK